MSGTHTFPDLLRIALDEASDQIYATDPETGAVLDCSDGACRALDYTREELLGLTFAEIDAGSQDSPRTVYRRSPSGDEISYRSTHRRRDGSTFHVGVNERRVSREGRTILLSYVRDISGQVALEEQLRASQRQYEGLVRNLPGVVHRCLLDPPSSTLFVDDRIEELTGVPAHHFIDGTRALDEFVSEEDREVVGKAWSHVAERGGNYDITLTFRRIDGQERVVREVGHVIRDGANEPATIEGIFFDITDRAEQERILREAFDAEHRRFEQVVAASRQVVYEIDFESRQVMFNGPLEEVFGWVQGAGGMALSAWYRNIHPEDLPILLDLANGPLTSATLYENEVRVLHADGKYRWAWDRALYDTDDAGRPLRAIGVVQDVTARKELEAQMNSAQRMETVGALAAGLAHDVNNYLTTILGNVEFALMTMPAEEHPELVDARDAAVGCAELVRKLLAFARPQQMQRERLDPGALLNDTARMLQRLAGAEISVSASAADGCGEFLVDRVQVQQLLMNLVANAREAMQGKGEIHISVSPARGTHNGTTGDFVCIEVRDSGPGIPAELRHRIFEPYFTTRRFGEGTGLGLSIVHGIVTSHQGWIDVDSPPDGGAIFRAYFPVA